ncbi:hypothetical protein AAMO2058_000943600 [Amorphochlora amoebiformis]
MLSPGSDTPRYLLLSPRKRLQQLIAKDWLVTAALAGNLMIMKFLREQVRARPSSFAVKAQSILAGNRGCLDVIRNLVSEAKMHVIRWKAMVGLHCITRPSCAISMLWCWYWSVDVPIRAVSKRENTDARGESALMEGVFRAKLEVAR